MTLELYALNQVRIKKLLIADLVLNGLQLQTLLIQLERSTYTPQQLLKGQMFQMRKGKRTSSLTVYVMQLKLTSTYQYLKLLVVSVIPNITNISIYQSLTFLKLQAVLKMNGCLQLLNASKTVEMFCTILEKAKCLKLVRLS